MRAGSTISGKVSLTSTTGYGSSLGPWTEWKAMYMKRGFDGGCAATMRATSAVSSVADYTPLTSAAVAQAGVSPALSLSVLELR